MTKRFGFASPIQQIAWWFLFGGVMTLASDGRTAAQTAEHASAVKRVTVDWHGNEKGSMAVRDHLERRLNASGRIQIVKDVALADAVLHGSAVMWTTGYMAMSPRSKAAEEATYRGYASVELTGKEGKTLWSYLVTPRRPGWKSISDDLAEQLANALVEAVEQKDRDKNGSASDGAVGSASGIRLRGSGATFPAPIYQKWFESFERLRPGIQISYDAVGSEEGIRRMRAGEVDFGASDMPLSGEQLQGHGDRMLQIATVLGAIVPIYNVKGAPDGLNLSPEVLAGIFLGKIRAWNAPEIHAINKSVRLPDQEIIVVHRSDGSGTTYAWTDYLSKVSRDWRSSVGAGTTVSWPVGVGAERNQGVADTVHKTPNAIGYVEFIYALQHELSFAAVHNASGEYVKADLDSVTAAARTIAATAGKEFQTSITNASGKHTYPIATFTWLLIPAQAKDPKKQEALGELLRWMLTSGQKQCQSLGYVPLPADLAAHELQLLEEGK